MARKRLNTNLLIALTAAIAVAALALYLGARYYADSPERAVRRAQDYEAAGKYRAAAGQWGKAYRATREPEYGLQVVDIMARLTGDDEKGDDNLKQMGQILNQLVTDNPDNQEVQRRTMRHYVSAPGFLSQRSTPATKQVRDAAQRLLEIDEGDTEAAIYFDATTLDLSNVPSEGLSDEEVVAARERLSQTVATSPVDGTGISALRADLPRRMSGMTADEDVMAEMDAFTAAVQAAVDAIDNDFTPREGMPTDDADAYVAAGQGLEASAAMADRTAQIAIVRSARDADEEADPVAARQAGIEASTSLREAAMEQYRKAIAALEGDREMRAKAFVLAHFALADVQRRQSDIAGATETLKYAYEQRPWDVRVAKSYADLLRDINQPAEARKVLEAADARAKEPLPELNGYEGAAARLQRAFVGLYLAEAALAERRAIRVAGTTTSAEQRDLLELAERAFDEYNQKAALLTLNRTFGVDKIEGLIQVARGETFAGMDTLERGLRDLEQIDNAFSRRERTSMLRLLADINREAGQSGGETEYLSRAFNLQGNVNDGLRLAELYRLSGQDSLAQDVLDRLEPIRASLPSGVQGQLDALSALVDTGGRAEAVAALPEETRTQKLAKINAASRAGVADVALRLTEEVLAETPEDATVGRVLAQLYARAGRNDDALEVARRFPEDDFMKRLVRAMDGSVTDIGETIEDPAQRKLYEAQVAERDGQPEVAVSLAGEARQAVAEGASIVERNQIDEAVFDLYLRNDALDEAETLADDMGRRGVDGAGGDLYRVRLQIAREDYDEAARQARALASRYPRMAEAQMVLSELLRRTGSPAEAAEAAEQALELAPTDIRAVIEAAAAYEAAGRVDEATQVVTQGLVQRPRDPRLRQMNDTLQLRYGDPESVLADRQAEVDANPDNASAWQRLAAAQGAAVSNAARSGDESATADRIEATVQTATEALAKFPDDARFLTILAGAGSLAGEEQKAEVRTVVDRVMTPSDPQTLIDDASAVGAAAAFYANADDYPSATTVVRRHLSRLPNDTPRDRRAFMLLALSQLLTQSGQGEEAADVLVGYDDVPQVKVRLVQLLAARANEAEGAEADELYDQLAEAVAGPSVPAESLLAAALAELRRNNAEDARELLARANEAQPDNAATIYLLGVAEGQVENPNLEQAVTYLERSAELRPSNLDAYRNLARVYRQLGRRDEAENAYLRLLEQDANDLRARLALVQMQLAESPPDYASADRYFRGGDATEAGNSPVLLMARARMEMDRGRATDAVTYGRRSVEASVEKRQTLAEEQRQPRDSSEAATANVASFLNGYLDLLLRSGRASEALREVDFWSARVSGSEGEPWWLMLRRAEALAREGRTSSARDAYAKTYETAVNTPRAQAGQVLLDMAKRVSPEAAYDLIKAQVESETPDPGMTMAAARIFAQAGDNDRAIDLVRQVRQAIAADGRELRPEQEAALSQQEGTLFLTANPPQLDSAVTAFRRSLATYPDNIAINNNLAYALTLLADENEDSDVARERLLVQAVERGNVALAGAEAAARRDGNAASPSVVDTVGWARAKLAMLTDDSQGLDEAVRLLRSARDDAERDGDGFPEVYVHLARSLRAQDNLEEALESAKVGLEFLNRRLDDPEERRPNDEQLLQTVRDLIRQMEDEVAATSVDE